MLRTKILVIFQFILKQIFKVNKFLDQFQKQKPLNRQTFAVDIEKINTFEDKIRYIMRSVVVF